MPRSKKTVKKNSAKAHVIVNVNSNNKRKVVSNPRSAPTSVTHFVSPTPQSNMHEGILMQLMHHVMKPKEHEKPREIELPPKHHVPTKVYVPSPPLVPDIPKVGFREPEPHLASLGETVKKKEGSVSHKPSVVNSGDETGFKTPEEHNRHTTRFQGLLRQIPKTPIVGSDTPSEADEVIRHLLMDEGYYSDASHKSVKTPYPTDRGQQQVYFTNKYGLKGIHNFNKEQIERLRDVELKHGNIALEASVIKRERKGPPRH